MFLLKLLALKCSYFIHFIFLCSYLFLLTTKITPHINYFLLFSHAVRDPVRIYTPMEDPITSPKMTLTMFKSFFCDVISNVFTNFSLVVLIQFILVKMRITRLDQQTQLVTHKVLFKLFQVYFTQKLNLKLRCYTDQIKNQMKWPNDFFFVASRSYLVWAPKTVVLKSLYTSLTEKK